MSTDPTRARLGDLWDDDVAAAVEQNPRASAACVRLLTDRPSSIEDGLVAESLAYAELQAGPEFALWLDERGPVTPVPSPEPVLLDREGDHLTITLNRPESHNAVDIALRDGLFEALELVEADPTLTVTLKGAGPSFCSGGDLREFGTFPDPASAHAIRLERLPARALAAVADRVTARVHGHCVGAGAELAAFCHRVVAHPGTTFRLPEVSMGLVPGQGGTVSLPRRIGPQRSAWLALTGRPIDVAKALEWGLVDELTSSGP
ncbi:MAG TPA: enoyl-CoA hydratase/isomerase family protein [Acidimicrobiales bacterium]